MPINRLSAFCVVAAAALLSGPAVQAHTGKSHAKPVHAKHVKHHHHSQVKLAHHKNSHSKAHIKLAHAVHRSDTAEVAAAAGVAEPSQQATANFDFSAAPQAGTFSSGLLLTGAVATHASASLPAWLKATSQGNLPGVAQADTPLVFAAAPSSTPAVAVASAGVRNVPAPAADAGNNSITDLRKALIAMAMNLRDIRYVRGGHDPSTGFDCSGFVRYVFAHAIGMQLPTNSASQFLAGLKVKRADMKPGDLVFFHTHGRRISHVGIYISDGRFIHSPTTGKSVEISSLDEAYWAKRFAGAKRPEGMAMVASKG